MNKLVLLLLSAAMLAFTAATEAKAVFTGVNYSGVYDCKGANEEIGDYEVTVTLKLNRVSSYSKVGTYQYQVETVNSTVYNGQAIANGNQLAISFDFNDKRNVEHSVGLAIMKKTGGNLWSFHKLYYEPDDNGGNYGTENCVINRSKTARKFAL